MRNKSHNRLAWVACAWGLIAARAAAWNVAQDLPGEIEDMADRLTAPVAQEKQEGLAKDLQNITYEISQAILSADSPDWSNPSPERRAIIEQAANVIEPYNRMLVEMAFDEQESGSREISRQCLSLLDYTRWDAQFQTAVEQQALRNPGTALQPFRLLYEHHALNESMRELASARIRQEPDPRKKMSLALASAEMGFDDAIPACEELLSKPFTSEGVADSKGGPGENKLISGYRRAADALLYLGPRAETLLPLLARRRDEIAGVLGPKGSALLVGNLNSAIDCVQGHRPMNFAVAVNGSGRLDTAAGGANSESAGLRAREVAESPAQASFVEDSRPPSQVPWAIVLIIVLISGIGVLFRKTAAE
jgi:hypothetical protein